MNQALGRQAVVTNSLMLLELKELRVRSLFLQLVNCSQQFIHKTRMITDMKVNVFPFNVALNIDLV